MNKAFFWFFWIFLAVITLMAFPKIILTSEYKKMFIFLIIFIFLMVLSIFLYKFMILSAYDFLIFNNQIKLLYKEKFAVEYLNNLERIIITPYRYIFIFIDNKYIVKRIKSKFNLEKNVDPRISYLSKKFDIKIERRKEGDRGRFYVLRKPHQ